MALGADQAIISRPSRRRVLTVALAAVAILAALLGPAYPARASETFVVTTTADAPDATSNDGLCATGGGECTLRAAVEQANASTAPDTIIVPAGQY
ncbi:MAG TPA: CSLREA domain-containing protein, partial [Jiangellales bacterium]|nr:CSLREA domain-containing protein [Jiangellales bacterium]